MGRGRGWTKTTTISSVWDRLDLKCPLENQVEISYKTEVDFGSPELSCRSASLQSNNIMVIPIKPNASLLPQE